MDKIFRWRNVGLTRGEPAPDHRYFRKSRHECATDHGMALRHLPTRAYFLGEHASNIHQGKRQEQEVAVAFADVDAHAVARKMQRIDVALVPVS